MQWLRPGFPRRKSACVAGDSLALEEDLDGVMRDSRVHLLTDQRVRDAVERSLNLDVVVYVYPAQLPLSVFVGCLRQWAEGELVRGLKQGLTRALQLLKRLPIQLFRELANRLVEFVKTEEHPMSQHGHDPALHDLNPNLGFRLIF